MNYVGFVTMILKNILQKKTFYEICFGSAGSASASACFADGSANAYQDLLNPMSLKCA